jgi:hypothetical protein
MELLGKGKNLSASAAKADMDDKTARKYWANYPAKSESTIPGGPGRIRLLKYGIR